VVHSAENQRELAQLIRDGILDKTRNRFNIWRMCLGALSFESDWQQKVEQLREDRQKYDELESKYVKKLETKKPAPEAPVAVSKNPLAQKMLSKPSAPVSTV
jgi:hypothetical protein